MLACAVQPVRVVANSVDCVERNIILKIDSGGNVRGGPSFQPGGTLLGLKASVYTGLPFNQVDRGVLQKRIR